MDKKIKVIIKNPIGRPYSTNISRRMENLVKIVGDVVAIGVSNGVVALCDGSRQKEKKVTRIGEVSFAGTVVLCGHQDGKLEDLPYSFAEMKIRHPEFWEVME